MQGRAWLYTPISLPIIDFYESSTLPAIYFSSVLVTQCRAPSQRTSPVYCIIPLHAPQTPSRLSVLGSKCTPQVWLQIASFCKELAQATTWTPHFATYQTSPFDLRIMAAYLLGFILYFSPFLVTAQFNTANMIKSLMRLLFSTGLPASITRDDDFFNEPSTMRPRLTAAAAKDFASADDAASPSTSSIYQVVAKGLPGVSMHYAARSA